ncbi:YrzE family protein [Paenibacillus sp. Leaf72]|uniref:YrzE family protein n=1 Tax=Paenibacillus sp. Leaf72 TaxID=1736234 RepID=UPI0006F3ECD7|nr:YrzE family protein [Paenibacillus sp. Leaf72]KQN96881.1 hypothetical protein ASF12_22700 [Paenibacillus sp. Leaf72]
MEWQNLVKIFKSSLFFISALAVFFGIVMYTTEHLGENGEPGPIRIFLDSKLSWGLLIAILYFIVVCFIGIFIYISTKGLKLKQEYDKQILYYEKQLHGAREQYVKLEQEELQNNKLRLHDVKLIKKLVEILPVQEMKYYCDETDFGNSFHERFTDMIAELKHTDGDPTYLFFNKELESEKQNILRLFREMDELFTNYIDRIDKTNHYQIDRNLRISFPVEYTKVIRMLNTYSTEAWTAYKKIISIGIEEYGVDLRE